MTWPALPLVLGFLTLQRLSELWISRRNASRLLAEGAFEVGAGHYPLFVVLNTAWILTMAVGIPLRTRPEPGLLAAFVLLQLGRLWVILSLGRYWTTRVITLPGAPLVRSGPFRLCRHPNYLVVVGEIAVLPLAFGAWEIATIFSLLNLPLVAHRIRVEEAVLRERR